MQNYQDDYNFLGLGLIPLILPDIKYFFCVRLLFFYSSYAYIELKSRNRMKVAMMGITTTVMSRKQSGSSQSWAH